MHAKPQDDHGEGLYTQLCLETGDWSEAYTSAETACVDVDECSSHPCLNGAECFATYPIAADTYHCACLPGSRSSPGHSNADINDAMPIFSHAQAPQRTFFVLGCSAVLTCRCRRNAECGMPGTASYKCLNGGTCYDSGSG